MCSQDWEARSQGKGGRQVDWQWQERVPCLSRGTTGGTPDPEMKGQEEIPTIREMGGRVAPGPSPARCVPGEFLFPSRFFDSHYPGGPVPDGTF